MAPDDLAESSARLSRTLERAAETSALPNHAIGALQRLKLSLRGPAQSAPLETMEADFSTVLVSVLNLESQIGDNIAANVPTYGQMLNMPMRSPPEIKRLGADLVEAFKSYKAARGETLRRS